MSTEQGLNDHRLALIKLRETTGASLTWCKKAYDENGFDFAKAQEVILQRIQKEGTNTGYLNHKGSGSPKFGKVVADVNVTNDIGVIVGLSCFTKEGANSNIFIDALDIVLLIALSKQPPNVSALLGTSIDTVKITHKGYDFREIDTVEEFLQSVSAKMRETVQIEHYKLIHQGLGKGEYIILYPYNHHNSQIASIVTFLVTTESKLKDVEWLKKRIAGAAACYNPLCVHEYTLTKSILDEVKNREEIELRNSMNAQEGDDKAVEHITQWKLENFLNNMVLDRIKIPMVPFQENNKPIGEVEIPLGTIVEACTVNNIAVIDFERFQTEIQGLII
jgi:translation elongation factor EF-Ts